MTDLISRQAAIDAILHNEEVYSNHFGDDPIDRYTVAIIDNDAQTLAQLPTIDPVKHGEWIKITERPMTTDERTKRSEELGYDVEYEESIVYTSALPDENDPVLVTREFSYGKRKKRYVEIASRIGNNWYSYSDEYKVGDHGKPIAWAPLPEPYKLKRSEE